MPDTRRRQTIEASWTVGVVLYVIARFIAAYSTLARYSRLNVIIFGVLDIVTAVPYAIGVARLITSLVDRRPQSAARWGALASACFLAPYLWIAWIGRNGQFPTIVYVVVAVLVVCLGANASYGVYRRVRAARLAETISTPDVSSSSL